MDEQMYAIFRFDENTESATWCANEKTHINMKAVVDELTDQLREAGNAGVVFAVPIAYLNWVR